MGKTLFIERSVTIDRPVEDVFAFVRYIGNHDQFSIWHSSDPDVRVTTSGQDGTVGFVHHWDSQLKKVGAGSQEITELLGREKIAYELRFERPMRATNHSEVTFLSLPEARTRVTWNFRGDMKFPLSLLSFVLKRMLGNDLQGNLDRLKKVMEEDRTPVHREG